MKKALLLSIATGVALSSFAQDAKIGVAKTYPSLNRAIVDMQQSANRTTDVIHDTLLLANMPLTTTPSLYYISRTGTATDSGYVTGMNFLDDNVFAERYDFKSPDSSIQVLGVLPYLLGNKDMNSTSSLKLMCWSQSAKIQARTNLWFNGIPDNGLDSVTVPFTSLDTIDATHASAYPFYFATPTPYLTDTFFVGVKFNYTWGATGTDTIGIASTAAGTRNNPSLYIVGIDTTVNNQNMVQNGGLWADFGFQVAGGFKTNLFIFPIVNSKIPSVVGVNSGVTRGNFTFLGNYPNPAVSNTNIKFSLANATDVTIQVMDITGRTIKTINQNNMTAGEHIYNMNVSDLAAGDYVYMIRTAEGGGIASKISIIK